MNSEINNVKCAQQMLANMRKIDFPNTRATVYPHEWISVENKLPEKNTSVLIFVPSYNEIHTAEFCEWGTCDEWHISFGKHTYECLTFDRKEVTHWMPLPQFP